MAEIISFLSGGIPGGVLLLLFFLLTVNLSLQFLAASKLMDHNLKKRRQLTYSLLILLIYGILWIQFRPPLPRQRVVALPIASQEGVISLEGSAFRLPEYLQQEALNNLTNRYLMHRWQWLLEAIPADSIKEPRAWISLARRMGALLIIESRKRDSRLEYRIYNKDDKTVSAWFVAEDTLNYRDLLDNLNEKLDIFENVRSVSHSEDRFLKAEALIILGKSEKALAVLHNLNKPQAQILRALIHFKKGLKIRIDREKAKYVKIQNPEFEQAKKILQTLVKNRQDNTQVAYLLGRIAVQEEKYDMAEVFLKKALIDDPTDARVYYALSFLLPARLEDLGYHKRTEVLEKALYYDPAFRDAVYELASEYYLSGTGTATGHGTTSAIRAITKYLKIRQGDPQILALLGSLYIKTNRLDEAQDIFTQLLQRFPQDSNLNYDLGIVFYHKKLYEKAIQYFRKAIKIDDNADAYLYLGLIYRDLGDPEKALHNFRERVRRRHGDDDTYAKEAMQGIRQILNKPVTESSGNAQ